MAEERVAKLWSPLIQRSQT
uniref:Uncharacterized protein n=1 Tax=Anguilla anguilla TaxID=7936 RepID=A0A0E9W2A8_ANGAN